VGERALSPVEAVIFDWGGTLAEYALVEFEQLWLRAAAHLDPEREVETAMHLAAVEATFWERTATDQRSGTLADILEEATSLLGWDVAQAVREEAAGLYLADWEPLIRHDEDAALVLRALRAQGLRIGLLSNTHWPRDYHERFLERDMLVDLIDARLYTSEMPFMKPHPAAFAAALDALGVADASHAVFVGDRLFDDISGARGVGMRAVLRRNPAVPEYDIEPDAVIDRLPELLPLIADWSR
jgi:putative hydrolase of the HAD superfamily